MSTAHMKTYDQVGKKEDVSDVISNITPTKTPFVSSIGTRKVSNTLFQWQEDSLRAVQANKNAEGFTASASNLDPTTMRSGYTQILQKTFVVSGTADAINTYGRAKETAYQMAKAGAEVKRDLEHALVGLNQTAVAGDSTTPRELTSVVSQIATANKVVTDSSSSTTGSQAGPLTEANVLIADQALYDGGAEATILMVKPADSLLVADFAKASGRYRNFNDGQKTVTNVVNLYVSPFGEKKVVIDRFIKSTDAILYDPSMWKLAVLRPWFRETLAKTGDNTQMMIVGEYGLQHSNQSASAAVTNLS